MNDFVWILNINKNSSFGEAGVSNNYIIPKGNMKVAPESLAGSRLWVLLRGAEDRIFLSLKVKKVEKIIEGYYNEDFLLHIDLLFSFRLVSKYSEATKYITTQVKAYEFGVSEINLNITENFSQIVFSNIEVRFDKPPEKLFFDTNSKILPPSGRSLALVSIRLIVSKFNLNQIWAQGTGKKLGAFSNFAYAFIAKKTSNQIAESVIASLKNFDPLFTLLQNGKAGNTKKIAYNYSYPKVDIEFTAIEIKKIYTREFIAGNNKFRNLESALNKTEYAEKTHQEMLKDIAGFLISKGVIPYESNSIDLIYQHSEALRVCEIKSTTSKNILAQSSKGSFQLSCYMEELLKSYPNATPQLILNKIGNKDLELYIIKILSRMNIPVLYYEPDKEWPDKIANLLPFG